MFHYFKHYLPIHVVFKNISNILLRRYFTYYLNKTFSSN